jgi:hypothetical protein
MIEKKLSNTEVSRELTFEEWKARDEDVYFNEDENWWEDKNDLELPGVNITYSLSISDWEKAKKYLKDCYWENVELYFQLFKEQLKTSWEELCDPVTVERQIELWTFTLYPEKFRNRELPILLTIFSYQTPDSGNSDSFNGRIARAYAEIQNEGRDVLQGRRELIENQHCVAEATKRYLDWLIGFQLYLATYKPTSETLLNFIEQEAVSSELDVNEERKGHEEKIRKHLFDLEEVFNRTGEYEKTISWLVSFFMREKIKIDKPVFIAGRNKTKLQSILGDIHDECASGKFSDDYIEFLVKTFEILHTENFNPTGRHAKDIRKRLSG